MSTTANDEQPDDRKSLSPRGGWTVWRGVRIALALGMVAAVIAVAGPARLWAALRDARYVWVLLAVPMAFLGAFFDAVKLWMLLKPQGHRAGLGSVFKTVLVVNAAALFLPSIIGGGAVAWYRLSKPDNLRAQSFTALSLNLVVKLVVLAALGILALALDAGAIGEYRAFIAPLSLVACLPVVGLVLMLGTGLSAWTKRVYERCFARFLPERAARAGSNVLESFENCRSEWGAVFGALAAGAGRKLLDGGVTLCALYAVGAEVSFVRVLWIVCAVEVASMIPLTLSAWGLFQVTYVGLFAAVGVAADTSLASHLIVWVAMLPVYLAGANILARESAGTGDC